MVESVRRAAELNSIRFEEQVNISNQNIKVAEAQYRQAQALVSDKRARRFSASSPPLRFANA